MNDNVDTLHHVKLPTPPPPHNNIFKYFHSYQYLIFCRLPHSCKFQNAFCNITFVCRSGCPDVWIFCSLHFDTTVWTTWRLNSCILAAMQCWQFAWNNFGSITKFSVLPSCDIECYLEGCWLLGCYCVLRQKFTNVSEKSIASIFRVEKQWLLVWNAYTKSLSNVQVQGSAQWHVTNAC
jgi:hypothetical protein